jgi:hypothetical protein
LEQKFLKCPGITELRRVFTPGLRWKRRGLPFVRRELIADRAERSDKFGKQFLLPAFFILVLK